MQTRRTLPPIWWLFYASHKTQSWIINQVIWGSSQCVSRMICYPCREQRRFQREDRLLQSESETISFPPSPFPPLTSPQMMHENEGKLRRQKKREHKANRFPINHFTPGCKESVKKKFRRRKSHKTTKRWWESIVFYLLDLGKICFWYCFHCKREFESVLRIDSATGAAATGTSPALRACTKIKWSIEVRTSKHVFYHNLRRERIVIYDVFERTLE